MKHPSIHANHHPERMALTFTPDGQSIDYKTLDTLSNRVAHLLRKHGLKKGDTIALLVDNCPSFFGIAWGAQRAGLYYVALSTRLLVDEIAYILDDSEPRILFVSHRLASLVEELKSPSIFYCVEGETDRLPGLAAALDQMPQTPISDESPGRDTLYSSGTTGRPKGVREPLLDGGICNPEPAHRMLTEQYGLTCDDVYLSPAPLYHSAPLRTCMAMHRVGGHVVSMRRFDPEQFLAAIEHYRVTVTQLVPTMFARLLRLPAEVRNRYDLSSLRVAVHAAAPCPVETKRQMLEWWGPIIHEYYSATEIAGMTAIGPEEWLRKQGSVGRAVLGEVRIVGDDDELLPGGETGQVYFQGGPPFEYHRDPVKTASVTGRHGVTFGDVGYLDEDGYLFLTDRKNYMIISGGVNIYPQEAENILGLHPKVSDVAVFGIPDDEMGESVKAVVQPVDWADIGPEFERELIDYVRARLSPIKCPRSVDFDSELPRHDTGKLYKRLIRQRYL